MVGMSYARVLAIVVMVCSLAFSCLAQTFQGQISGEVRDATGAIVPNAKLTATNIATNTPFTTQSNEQGLYRFLALPPGQYNVTASLTGFKSYERGPITLQVNDNITLDISLQIGDASETVQVSAAR